VLYYVCNMNDVYFMKIQEWYIYVYTHMECFVTQVGGGVQN